MSDTRSYGRYQLIAEIGRGGMAEVYLAVSGGPAGFKKLFVIKQPRPEMMERADLLDMFLHEARIAARLNHRNIVQIYEAAEAGGPDNRPFIVMEFLEGQPLSKAWRKSDNRPPMPLEMSVEILRELLTGLHAFHEARDLDGTPHALVHRDVSPHNLFLTYDGQVKLLDFGIAKNLDADDQTLAGFLKGKVRYMAPEQARTEAVDRRTDLFSVGVMMHRVITGHSLWGRTPDMQVLRRLNQDEIPDLRTEGGVDPALADICRRALSADPSDRYPDAATMRAALEGWLEGRSSFGPTGLGDWLTEWFSGERAELQATLSGRLAELESEGGLDSMAGQSGELSASQPRVKPLASGMEVPRLRLDSLEPRSSGSSSTGVHQAPSQHTPMPTGEVRRGGGWIWAVGGGLIGIVGVVAGIKLASDSGTQPPAPAPAPPPVEAPRLSGPAAKLDAAAQPMRRLVVTATPAEARITLDDRPLGAGRFDGAVLQVGQTYTLKLTAPGFESLEVPVAGQGDPVLTLNLTPSQAEAAPEPEKPSKEDEATGSSARPTSAGRSGRRGRRGTDRDKPSSKKPGADAVATGKAGGQGAGENNPAVATPPDQGKKPGGFAPGRKPQRTIDTESPY